MRKQALDLAQQAQAAACLYLDFDPHEIHNWDQWQKNVERRPVELHLHHHHHHHHYMDKPGRSLNNGCGNQESNSNAGDLRLEDVSRRKQLYLESEHCLLHDYAEVSSSTKPVDANPLLVENARVKSAYEGGELSNLIRNFSKLLDSKLKEETLVKVTQAIAAVVDEEALGSRRHPSLEAPNRDEEALSRFSACRTREQTYRKSSHGQTHTRFNSRDTLGYRQEQPTHRQQGILEGYSNVYVSPVFEDRASTTASEKTLEESASLMYISYEQKNKVHQMQQCTDVHSGEVAELREPLRRDPVHENANSEEVATAKPDQGELRNFEAAVQNLGMVCQEHEQKLESLNFGNKDHQDVKDMRNHYLNILKGMGRNVTELHRKLEEEREGSCSNCWNNNSKVLGLTAVIKSKDEALSSAQELNQRLSTEITKTEASLAMLRTHCSSLQASLQAEVEESKCEMQSLQDQTSKVKQELLQSIADKESELQQVKQRASSILEQSLAEKEKELQQAKLELCSMQRQADNALLEKYEAVRKMHEFRKDADEQRQRVDELVSINDELLVFARCKETELTIQQTSLRGLEDEKTKLIKEIEVLKSEVKDRGALFLERSSLHAKLAEAEYELAQREQALKRVSSQLASTIEAQDSVMEERARLQEAKVQRDSTIQDLEQKLSRMEEELLGARREVNDLKRQARAENDREDPFSLLNDSEDTSWRIQQLEEELMEKEGQIAILKSSFRDQYDSMF